MVGSFVPPQGAHSAVFHVPGRRFFPGHRRPLRRGARGRRADEPLSGLRRRGSHVSARGEGVGGGVSRVDASLPALRIRQLSLLASLVRMTWCCCVLAVAIGVDGGGGFVVAGGGGGWWRAVLNALLLFMVVLLFLLFFSSMLVVVVGVGGG